MLEKRKVVALKAESTKGTAETLTAAEANYNLYNLNFGNNTEVIRHESSNGSAPIGHSTGAPSGSIDLSYNLGWNGTSTLPTWTNILLASGFTNTSGVFKPKTEAPGSNVKTYTIGILNETTRFLLRGAMANTVMTFVAGKQPTATANFVGAMAPVADVTALTPTLTKDAALKFSNAKLKWGDAELCPETLTLTLGGTIELIACPNSDGFSYAAKVLHDIRVSVDPLTLTVAQADRYGMFLSGAVDDLTWVLPAPDGGEIQFAMPVAQITAISPGARAGHTVDNIEFTACQNGSTIDSEFSISFVEGV